MSAAKRANCVRAAAVSGVVLLPKFMTDATMRMPRKSPAAPIACKAASWSAGTAVWPGSQIAETRMVSKPAALASCILAIATAGSEFRPSSSAAPMYIRPLASAWVARTSAARAQTNAMRDRSRGKRMALVASRNPGAASVGNPVRQRQ